MSEKSAPSIAPMPNGPYLVKDLETLTNSKGSIESKPIMALCRCGSSANKPFCDGTHAQIGFSGEKEEGRTEDRYQSFTGAAITVHDNRGICAHAAKCTGGLPSVFLYGQEPWINPDGASPAEVEATIRQCPSGALSYSIEGKKGEAPESEPAIHVAKNGPYVVSGGPALVDVEQGQGASRERYTLCRCGGSKNKPFCDGSHGRIKFSDDDN